LKYKSLHKKSPSEKEGDLSSTLIFQDSPVGFSTARKPVAETSMGQFPPSLCISYLIVSKHTMVDYCGQ